MDKGLVSCCSHDFSGLQLLDCDVSEFMVVKEVPNVRPDPSVHNQGR